MRIEDHYVDESRLRLRQLTHADGTVVRKLGREVRLNEGPEKTRHVIERDSYVVAVDGLDDETWNGTAVAR